MPQRQKLNIICGMIKRKIYLCFICFYNNWFIVFKMNQDKQTMGTNSAAQLNIIKALEFAGDNSSYQKKRLMLASLLILSLAILTSKVPFMGPQIIILYFLACGLGQFIGIIYFSVRQIAFFLFISAIFASIVYPFSDWLVNLSYLCIGFFAKGFFGKMLIYINEIGGQRFKAWSIIVIFAIWGLSTLISSLQKMINITIWIWYYGTIFIPTLIGCYFIMKVWKRSPYEFYSKKKFKQAKEVLNQIAAQNQRPYIPYCLEGQFQHDQFIQSKKPSYFQIVHDPILRKITIPLVFIWIFKEYVYFGSFTLVPELSNEYSKNYILISISQTVAVLMSYPIRLKIRRINAIFGLILIIGICSLVSSFSVVPLQCMPKGYICTTKYIYRISIMLIRFSIALLGNILINYTLEIYPSNVRNLAFGFFISISSFGSIILPWINLGFIHAGYSGFIFFTVASIVSLYFITQLKQTYGIMCTEKLEELDKKSVMIPLQNFKNLHF